MTSQTAHISEDAQSDRRGMNRSELPFVKLICDGVSYVPDNWSLGGCLITQYSGKLRPGTSVLVELFLNIDHEHDGLPVRAEIVRYEPDNDHALALRFEDLNAQKILEYCNLAEENAKANS